MTHLQTITTNTDRACLYGKPAWILGLSNKYRHIYTYTHIHTLRMTKISGFGWRGVCVLFLSVFRLKPAWIKGFPYRQPLSVQTSAFQNGQGF